MKPPPKLVCLESYWNERMFQTFSVKGFFEAMAPLVHPPLVVAHRFVESEGGREYYAKRPGGVIWRQKELFDAPVYYLAFHGARRFLKETGTRAVIGYGTTVDWMASLVADMLFLHRFYSDPSPWRNLKRIFASVHRDYPRAKRLGHTLITRD